MRQPRLTEVACWAHARRNIYEVYESTASPLAKEALERSAELFEIETRINGRAPQERSELAEARAWQDRLRAIDEIDSGSFRRRS